MVHKCSVVTAKDGHKVPVIYCDGKAVHLGSMYDGTYAAERWVATYMKEGMENIFLYGMGDGKILAALLQAVPGNIVVYEPNDQIYKEMKHTPLIKKMAAVSRVSIQHGTSLERVMELHEALRTVLNQNWVDETMAVCHPCYSRLYPKTLEMFLEFCRMISQEIKDMRPSVERFIDSMLVNQLHNISYMRDGIPLTRLKPGWRKDIPVVIVSAGPSLDKNVEALKKAKGKAYIFCVDVALPTLLRHGIRPDIIGCLDANKNMSFYQDESSYDIPLLVTEQVPEELLQKSTGKRVWAYLHEFTVQIADRAGIQSPSVQYHLGVATELLASALELGTEKIILVGQDLAYAPDGRTHAVGRDEGMVCEEERFRVKGYYGGEIWSRYDWHITREWFEKTIRNYKDRAVINATEGGAAIEGTVPMPLGEVLDALPYPEEPAEFSMELERDGCVITKEELDILFAERKRCVEDLEKIRQWGYHKTFFEEDYKQLPVVQLVIEYMKSLTEPSREKRFWMAVEAVSGVCGKECV